MRATIVLRFTTILALAGPTASMAGAQTLAAGDIVGKWGLASYFEDKDAARTLVDARAQCNAPYAIGRGPGGGVMMHLPDDPKSRELVVKASAGTTYIGPEGEAGGKLDRKVLRFDGKFLVLAWLDPSVGSRYGIMVFARCGK